MEARATLVATLVGAHQNGIGGPFPPAIPRTGHRLNKLHRSVADLWNRTPITARKKHLPATPQPDLVPSCGAISPSRTKRSLRGLFDKSDKPNLPRYYFVRLVIYWNSRRLALR